MALPRSTDHLWLVAGETGCHHVRSCDQAKLGYGTTFESRHHDRPDRSNLVTTA